MHNTNPFGLFDEYFLLEKLSKLGDPLEKLDNFINWKIFNDLIDSAFYDDTKDPSKGGRTPYPKAMLFKGIIIQSLYNLSEAQLEFQIVDRASFKRFLGLKCSDKVPDSNTFWLFREELIENHLIEKLFLSFNESLENAGIIAHEGKIIDASFVEVPKQRNSRAENAAIKETGSAPDEWEKKPRKKSQKDTDARWTKKNNITFYGYKNHVKIDSKTKLITAYEVTDASIHDSQVIEKLITEEDKGQHVYADSAYTGEKQFDIYRLKDVIPEINEKGYRNNPLTEEQKLSNKQKSKIRARVEHVFGFMENSMNGSFIRTIGIIRANAKIGLINLTYNICRFVQLKKLSLLG